MARTAYLDENWEPEILEPLWIEWSEIPGRGVVEGWGGADRWRCREHPDWRGEVMTRKDVAFWEEHGDYLDEIGGPQGMYDRESVEAHYLLHDVIIGPRKRPDVA